jgi:Raf kinase inhibitor-like YbhB/YbcL family protein
VGVALRRQLGCLAAAAALAALLIAGCGGGNSGVTSSAPASGGPAPAQLGISSSDISGAAFPRDLTCDGANRQPAITLSAIPSGTQSLALEMIDTDAPSRRFTHWLIFADGQPSAASISFPPANSVEGKNDAGGNGYTGVCPPPGPVHHYHLAVFATSFALGPGGAGLSPGFTRDQLDSAVTSSRGTVLARGELVATYGR